MRERTHSGRDVDRLRARKQAVHHAFQKTGLAYAEKAFSGIRTLLDQYVAAWGAMYGDACRATHVRGDQSAEAPSPVVPAQRDSEPNRPRRPALTERELQVLHGMADGKSNAEIGRDLFVSEDTVKTHARRLFRKLGARDRAHAVASGFRSGLVS